MSSSTLPTTSTASTATAPTVKLRDSCHACASSKLRCSKEKPTCSRCAKRGKACQYFVTRRAGRKQGSKISTDATGPAAGSSSSAWRSGSSNGDVLVASQPPETAVMGGSIHVLQDQYSNSNNSYADSSSDLLASISSSTSGVPTPGDIILDFDELFPSPLDGSLGDGSDISSCTDFFFGQNCLLDPTLAWPQVLDKAGLKLGQDVRILDTSSISSTGSSSTLHFPPPSQLQPQPQSQQQQPDHEAQRQQQAQQQTSSSGPPQNSPSCACVAQTLSLVSQLFQESAALPPTSPMSLSPGPSSGSSQNCGGTINSPLADGEHAIETIRSMLQCPCQQDSHLLALMSLVVFKAVARYQDAARRSTENAETALAQGTSLYGAAATADSGRTGLAIDEENPHPKLAAQTLLGKLHRVQGLVNAMAERLKSNGSSKANNNDTNKVGDMRTRAESSFANERRETLGSDLANASAPFSTTLLSQLEEDLRKQVRSVSQQLVNILREL